MKKLLDPRLILLVNTIPTLILLLLGWSDFELIKSTLDEMNIVMWGRFALFLILLATLNIIYAGVRIWQKKTIDIGYCIIALVVYIIYLYLFFNSYDNLFPFRTPSWMGSGNLQLYAGSFLMPTLLYALFGAVVLLTKVDRKRAYINLIVGISIPLLFYVLGVVVSTLWNGAFWRVEDLLVIIVIFATVLFLFFILRFIYIFTVTEKRNRWFYSVSKLLFSLVFPIIGLVLNHYYKNPFGDFQSYWFYIICVLNGILVVLPRFEEPRYRLLLFIGRSITFSFTLYFFFVMMPFLPFSFIAILVFGIGFLMLTPLVLFPIHLNELVSDFKALKKHYKKIVLYSISVCGFMVIPIAITINNLSDRHTILSALEYLYTPDYSKKYDLNRNSISRMIGELETRRNNNSSPYGTTPFLTSYYRWLVLDNMNISDSKRKLIMNTFLGSDAYPSFRNRNTEPERTKDICIQEITHKSEYDVAQNAWVSWVDMKIKNDSVPIWNAEYITSFELPTGCWISDYYLYVEDVKEMGILAEKKAATWIYNQIRNENRDPGFLRYKGGNQVEFKVFPFQIEEVRLTGIEFIHKEPVTLNIDGHELKLGNHELQTVSKSSSLANEIVYISSEEKARLDTIVRKPYYHFIVDVSDNKSYVNSDLRDDNYINQINGLLNRNLISPKNAKISFVNTYTNTKPITEEWKSDLKNFDPEGGFFLDRAIKTSLSDVYRNRTDSFPVFVVVSEVPEQAVMLDDLSDWNFAAPEGQVFYTLEDGTLNLHTFDSGMQISERDIKQIVNNKVKPWPDKSNPKAYLSNDNEPSIVINTNNEILQARVNDVKHKDWQSGLTMQGQWMLQTLYPQTANEEWLKLIQNSFKTGIMTPSTAYLVVENEMQKVMLKRKQEQALAGNKSLDLDEDTMRMDEPEILIVVAILLFLFLLKKHRESKKNKIIINN